MLKRLWIENFKCFDDVDLTFGEHALLMGVNGTGKSTVVEILERLRRLLVGGEKARDCFPPSTRTHGSDSADPQRFELAIDVNGGAVSVRIELSPPDEAGIVRVVEEILRAPGASLERRPGTPIRIHENLGARDGGDLLVPEELAALPLVANRTPRSGLLDDSLARVLLAVADIVPFHLAPTRMEVLARRPNAVLESDGANFPEWLLVMEKHFTDRRDAIEKRVAAMLPGFHKFLFVPEGDQFRLTTYWKSSSGRVGRFDFDELSDGQRLVMVLCGIAVAVEERPGTLVLDEPDNYVALPEIQPLLLEFLDQPGLQLVVASHHPEIIDLMAKDYGIVFEREDDIGPVRVRRWKAAPDAVLTPSELVARGELGGGA